MSELKYMTLAEASAYVQLNNEKLREAVKQGLKLPSLPRQVQFLVSRPSQFIFGGLFIFGLVVSFIGGVIFDVPTINDNIGIAILVVGAAFWISAFLLLWLRYYFLRRLRKAVVFDDIEAFRTFFANHFPSLVISGQVPLNEAKIMPRHPIVASPRAYASRVNPGVMGTLNGVEFKSYWAVWQNTAMPSTGNRDKKARSLGRMHYVLGVELSQLPQRFDGFELEVAYPLVPAHASAQFHNKRVMLENASFESRVAISTNDEVVLRRVLTPKVQELILTRINNQLEYTELIIENNLASLLRYDNHENFAIKYPYRQSREQIIASYTTNFEANLAHFLTFISHVSEYTVLLGS